VCYAREILAMKSLLRLKPYLKPYFWLILGSLLLAIPLSALRFSVAPFVQHFVDDLLKNKDARTVWLYPTIFVALFFLNFLVRFPHYYMLRIVVARVNQKLKNDLYEHVMGLSADYFTSQSTGTLISRVGTDPQYIDGGLSSMNTLIREPITFLFLFSYALYLDWRLTIITFLILPPLAYVFSATGRNLKRYISRMQEENARLFSTLQESFTGVRVVKTFRLEKYVRKKFRERSENFTNFLLKTAVLEETSHPMVELLTSFAVAGVLYYGGKRVYEGEMTAGDLIGFCTAFALMMNPLRLLNDVNIKLTSAAAAATRIFEIFDWKSNLTERPNPKRIREFAGMLAFENVRFAYPDSPERQVLKDVSFTVPKSKAVAIVGASGAGKSSLVSLIPRIFDVTGGAIKIDGQDIRDLDFEDLRRLIAVVSQDVFLFNDTVEENIRCGRLYASSEEIREAARRAHVTEFINRLPDGFNTVIGDRGQKLSGGERQRLSIARAFLRESPILILDEATSSLDTASERVVQQALEELMQNKTTILIAHRLSTIRHADQILVMKEGEIVESGSHEALLAKNGEYARFHQMGTVVTA
jgi:ATP-binding cassette, subfamily B, bacterial MsbA